MKLIILEGGDQLGKSTLIEGICKHFCYDNVTIRHFGKPPKDIKNILNFQFNAFMREQDLFFHIAYHDNQKYNYYPNILIWNRGHLGEYVYGQMFRKAHPEELKLRLIGFEKYFVSYNVYLITLTADPNFFFSKEDGNSFSNDLITKTKELELFKEAHEFSIIRNKLIVKVDHNGKFWPKQDILNKVINFINI